MSAAAVPERIIKNIEDTACTRRCNGERPSNELLVVFGLTKSAQEVADEGDLVQWFLKCLDSISERVFDGHNYNWNIISQVAYENFDDAEPDGPPIILNRIVFAIHIGEGPSEMDYTDDSCTLVPFEPLPSHTLVPKEVMDCLVGEPSFVNRIGVSAVSSEVMASWWCEMISKETSHMDKPGLGYMRHRMWMKFTDRQCGNPHKEYGTWVSVREMSFNFGWKNYDSLLKERRMD